MKTVRILICFSVALACVTVINGCSGSAANRVDESTLTTQEQVFLAARSGDVAKLQSLLAAEPELVDVRASNGSTPLHAAASAGQDAAVQFLLDSGADPAAEDEMNVTPDNAAAVEGHTSTAELLRQAMQ